MNSDQIADILGQLAHTTRKIWGDGPADGEELTRRKEALGERYEKAFYLIYGGMQHLCNEIQTKYYKKDTLRELDTLLLDLRDYLDEAATPIPRKQGSKKKHKQQGDGQTPELPPQPLVCISMHQYETWSKHTKAIGGMIGNYKKYVEGKQTK